MKLPEGSKPDFMCDLLANRKQKLSIIVTTHPKWSPGKITLYKENLQKFAAASWALCPRAAKLGLTIITANCPGLTRSIMKCLHFETACLKALSTFLWLPGKEVHVTKVYLHSPYCLAKIGF